MMAGMPIVRRRGGPAALKWATTAARSLVAAAGVVLVTLTIAFVIFSALPSDPVRNALGLNASEEAVRTLRRDLGYDRSISERYAQFFVDAIRLDFGRSIHSRHEVTPIVLEAVVLTARSAAGALCLAAIVSVVLAFFAQMNWKIERGVLFLCHVLTSIPSLIVAITAGVAAYSLLGGFSDGGTRAAMGAIAALAVYPTCSLTEIAILETRRVQKSTFVAAARSFGMSDSMIFAHCILPPILTTWVGHLSNMVASIFVSSSVFDAVFSLPGSGHVLVQSVIQNDLPVVQGLIVVIVIAFLGLDALFDRLLLPHLATYGGRTAS